MQYLMATWIVLAMCASPIGASSFLSRAQGEVTEIMTSELQSNILLKIEEMLAANNADSGRRLSQIEDVLHTTFNSMPKNAHGKLEHAAVRYALHSYFVQRHGWYVRGLSDVGEGFIAGATSTNGGFQEQVEEFVQSVFEQRVGAHGLNLREMATLAATFENLVRQESIERLNATLRVLNLTGSREMDTPTAIDVLETYMMSYLVRFNLTFNSLAYVRERINKIYPAWPETQQFLHEVRQQGGNRRSFYTYSEIFNVLEDVGDRYGRWQDRECKDLKKMLLLMEDKSIGTNGSGRVRIADFYGSAVNDGNWQFRESTDYLKQLGVLDSTNPGIPRVIIPNYINSPSNCLAGSKYYSVCCINECEDLVDALEHHFQAPTASVLHILKKVSSLGSSTLPAGRSLHPILVSRLEEIAERHHGEVPLHSRLFMQWMHHAFPRECPYPHMAGTIKPQRSREYKRETKLSPTIKKEDLPDHVEAWRVEHASAQIDLDAGEECTTWSDDEELYVGQNMSRRNPVLRSLAYVAIACAVAVILCRRVMNGRKAVAWATSGAGKDIFV